MRWLASSYPKSQGALIGGLLLLALLAAVVLPVIYQLCTSLSSTSASINLMLQQKAKQLEERISIYLTPNETKWVYMGLYPAIIINNTGYTKVVVERVYLLNATTTTIFYAPSICGDLKLCGIIDLAHAAKHPLVAKAEPSIWGCKVGVLRGYKLVKCFDDREGKLPVLAPGEALFIKLAVDSTYLPELIAKTETALTTVASSEKAAPTPVIEQVVKKVVEKVIKENKTNEEEELPFKWAIPIELTPVLIKKDEMPYGVFLIHLDLSKPIKKGKLKKDFSNMRVELCDDKWKNCKPIPFYIPPPDEIKDYSKNGYKDVWIYIKIPEKIISWKVYKIRVVYGPGVKHKNYDPAKDVGLVVGPKWLDWAAIAMSTYSGYWQGSIEMYPKKITCKEISPIFIPFIPGNYAWYIWRCDGPYSPSYYLCQTNDWSWPIFFSWWYSYYQSLRVNVGTCTYSVTWSYYRWASCNDLKKLDWWCKGGVTRFRNTFQYFWMPNPVTLVGAIIPDEYAYEHGYYILIKAPEPYGDWGSDLTDIDDRVLIPVLSRPGVKVRFWMGAFHIHYIKYFYMFLSLEPDDGRKIAYQAYGGYTPAWVKLYDIKRPTTLVLIVASGIHPVPLQRWIGSLLDYALPPYLPSGGYDYTVGKETMITEG